MESQLGKSPLIDSFMSSRVSSSNIVIGSLLKNAEQPWLLVMVLNFVGSGFNLYF